MILTSDETITIVETTTDEGLVLASGGTWIFDSTTTLWQLQSSILSELHVFGNLIYNNEEENAI